MERDAVRNAHNSAVDISTHTLTWSVTIRVMNQYGFDVISTHTLTWSVKNAKEVKDLALNFNSHAHVERDFQCSPNENRAIISTHTLTWSVTR